jgi:hypothetical protein
MMMPTTMAVACGSVMARVNCMGLRRVGRSPPERYPQMTQIT